MIKNCRFISISMTYLPNSNWTYASVFLTVVLLLPVVMSAVQTTGQFADPGILPDSPFYSLKKTFEVVELLFTPDPVAKAVKHMKFSELRLAEAAEMAKQGRMGHFDSLMADYENELAQAGQQVDETTDSDKKEQVYLTVMNATMNHVQTLETVRAQVPAHAALKIAEAEQRSLNGNLNTLNSLSRINPELAEQVYEEESQLIGWGSDNSGGQGQQQDMGGQDNTPITSSPANQTNQTIPAEGSKFQCPLDFSFIPSEPGPIAGLSGFPPEFKSFNTDVEINIEGEKWYVSLKKGTFYYNGREVQGSPDYIISTGSCTANELINDTSSENIARLYDEGRISIKGTTLMARIQLELFKAMVKEKLAEIGTDSG